MHAVVYVQSDTSDGAGELRGEEGQSGSANIVGAELHVRERSVVLHVIDAEVDVSLLRAQSLANSRRGTRLERASRDRVNADAPLASSLERQSPGVRLKLSFGRGHAASVSRDSSLSGDVADGDHASAWAHVRPELLHHRDHRVCGGGRRREVTLARGLKKRLGHFGTVGNRVHQEVDFTVLRMRLGSDAPNVESTQPSVVLVLENLGRDLLLVRESEIERVYLLDLHAFSVGQLCIITEALVQCLLEAPKHDGPSSDQHLASGLS
mmetsp:Transcript_49172/g.100385  ORF Transcript_49172/g.100385 Transcript_49172/m.100385 type:complete len:266 (+) Transcript_49172:302-1099(+)